MNTIKQVLLTGGAALCLFGTAFAQTDAVLAETDVATHRGASVKAKGANGADRVKSFLAGKGRDAGTIASLVQTSAREGRGGVRHLTFEQRVDGKRVHGALVKAAIGADEELLVVSERVAKAGRAVGRSVLDAEGAVNAALRANHGGKASAPGQVKKDGNVTTFAKSDFFHAEPTAEAVVVARKNGSLEPGWLVTTWSEADNQLFETLIDARGHVVSTESRTAEDSYKVFADHPGVSPQTIVQGPGAGNAQSPSGWLSGSQGATLIQGNNARAYLDRNNDNAPDGAGRTITDGNFVTTANLSQSATTAANQEVAVQNLFYFNNLIHDRLYSYGFDEAARNFQENNFGKGGLGSDSVEAQAQDGGGTNNANFATPSDGSNPRMQMYLWSYTNPGRDGDLDSDIIWHEYGHGLTWRMIGSMSGAISGAIGEGMGDVLAIIENDDDRVGEYSTNDAAGIRSARYTNYSRTLGDFSGSSVHFDGEIYAATLWDMWQGYQAAGHDKATIMGDVVDGMNFTAPGPDYLDMRDGILDATPSSRDCLVWKSFAAYGMGPGASIGTKGRRYTITEDFSAPAACDGGTDPEPPTGGDEELTGLSGSSTGAGKNKWRATANVSTNTAGTSVGYRWSSGGSGTCTTGSSGTCTVNSPTYRTNRQSSVTFTVETIAGAPVVAASGVPTSVTINRP